MVRFFFPGRPIAQKRARFSRGRVFDPSFAEKRRIRSIMKNNNKGNKLLDGPLVVRLEFNFAPPKSWPKKKLRLLCEEGVPHVIKPDIDNLIKFYLDCSKNILWTDDCQVVKVISNKNYSLAEGVFMEICLHSDVEEADSELLLDIASLAERIVINRNANKESFFEQVRLADAVNRLMEGI